MLVGKQLGDGAYESFDATASMASRDNVPLMYESSVETSRSGLCARKSKELRRDPVGLLKMSSGKRRRGFGPRALAESGVDGESIGVAGATGTHEQRSNSEHFLSCSEVFLSSSKLFLTSSRRSSKDHCSRLSASMVRSRVDIDRRGRPSICGERGDRGDLSSMKDKEEKKKKGYGKQQEENARFTKAYVHSSLSSVAA